MPSSTPSYGGKSGNGNNSRGEDHAMDVTLQKDGVKIRVLEGPYLEDGQPTRRAVKDYTRLIRQLDDLKGYAADRLLDLYNNTWRDDEIGTVDRASFMHKLSKPSIHLYDELGAAGVYFEDGGLFAGHRIEVSVNGGVPTDAGIIG